MSTLEATLIVMLISLGVLFVVLLGALPGHIAKKRNHPNANAIANCGMLGLLLTGGFLWVVALVWAYTVPLSAALPPSSKPRRDWDDDLNGLGTKACPYCAETIKWAAVVCKHCGRDLEKEEPAVLSPDPEFDRLIEEELAGGPRAWRVCGIRDGKQARGTITADSEEAARRGAAKHFSRIISVEPA